MPVARFIELGLASDDGSGVSGSLPWQQSRIEIGGPLLIERPAQASASIADDVDGVLGIQTGQAIGRRESVQHVVVVDLQAHHFAGPALDHAEIERAGSRIGQRFVA